MKHYVLVIFLTIVISGCVQNNVTNSFDVYFEYPKEVRCGVPFSIKSKISNNIDHSVNNFKLEIENKFNTDIIGIACDGKKNEYGCEFDKIDEGDQKEIVFNIKPPKHYCLPGSKILKIYPEISLSYDSIDESNIFIPIESGLFTGISSVKKMKTNGPVSVEIIIPEEKNYVSPGEIIDTEFVFVSDPSSDVIIEKNNVDIRLTNLYIYDDKNCDFTLSKPKEDIKVNQIPLFCSFKINEKSGEKAIISVNYKYNYKKTQTFEINIKG